MKKLILALSIALLGASYASAQRYLTATDETDVEEIFESPIHAGVIIHASDDLTLRGFNSNIDKEVQLAQKQFDDENNEIYYCLMFTPGRRTLSISFDGYYDCDLNLDLDQGRMYRYKVVDPNVSATGSYFHKRLREGLSYFDQCDYHSARDEFMHAYRWSQATDSDRVEAHQLVANCDSLLYHRKLGYLYADKLQYEDAIQHFNAAMRLNPRDHEINDMLSLCYDESAQMCNHYMNQGDEYMRQKEYAEAAEMYQKVIDRNCDYAAVALSKRSEAYGMLNKRNEFGSYFGIDFGHLKGFTVGTYRKRNGGFFSLKTNMEMFDLLARNYDLKKTPEINVSFGWTLPVYTQKQGPLLGGWLHAGIGLSTAAQYGPSSKLTTTYMYTAQWTDSGMPSELNDLTNQDLERFISVWNKDNPRATIEMDDLLNPSFGFAVTPELGVSVKVWHFMARLSWQYNFALNSDYDDVFGKSRLYFGIGYCW